MADNRQVSELEARRIVTEELLEIDGILHRHAPPPCWGACIGSNFPYATGRSGISIRGMFGEAEGLALLPISGRDVAEQLTADMDAVLDRRIRASGGNRYVPREPMIVPDQWIEAEREVAEPDYDRLSALKLADSLRYAFADAPIGRVPFDVLEAYTGFLRATSDGAEDILDRAAELQRLATPERDAAWPRISQPLVEAEVLLRREELLRGRDYDETAIAAAF